MRLFAWVLVGMISQGVSASPQVYFSPGGNVQKRLVAAIDATSRSLDLALFELSSKALISALKRAGVRGVSVRLILDEKTLKQHRQTTALASVPNISLRTLHGREKRGNGMMHNKFAVFDESRVVAGSYNWSQAAEYANYENAIFEDDPNVVRAYAAEFVDLWAGAKPVSDVSDWGPPFPKHHVFQYPTH